MQMYECTEAGFFLGHYYKVGDRARFHARQVAADGHRWQMVTAAADVPAESAPDAAAAPRSKARR